MSDEARIDDLRRRLSSDPSSIAFAQLAEELRRTGRQAEAVVVSRAGLVLYPDYVSARVTLGRALLDLNRVAEAETQLQQVTHSAPDNVAALRALADIHERQTGQKHPSSAPLRLAVHRPPPAGPPVAAPALQVRKVGEVEYLRIVRTLAALESWLAALYVTRPERHA